MLDNPASGSLAGHPKTTAATPFPPALAAEARERDLYRRGLRVLALYSSADLAKMLEDVHAAVYAAQADAALNGCGWAGFEGVERIDTDVLEDAAAILRNAGRG